MTNAEAARIDAIISRTFGANADVGKALAAVRTPDDICPVCGGCGECPADCECGREATPIEKEAGHHEQAS